MKRKAIQDLLQTTEPTEAAEKIANLVPVGLSTKKIAAAARLILESAVTKSQKDSLLDVIDFYSTVCLNSPASLAEFLAGTSASELDQTSLAAAQSLLKEVLTSKAGRKKTSDLSRAEQLAAAQVRRREKIKKQGRKQLNVWISHEAAEYLEIITTKFSCNSQAEALELVLDSAIKGNLLRT